MTTSIRRIVTEQAPDSPSRICSDGEPPFQVKLPGGSTVTNIWQTLSALEVMGAGGYEATDERLVVDAPHGGTSFSVADFAPASDAPLSSALSATEVREMGLSEAMFDHGDPRGLFHRTETLDYCIILDGQITHVTEDGETILKQGDILVQQGSTHLWHNHTDRNCRVAFVMVDARFPH